MRTRIYSFLAKMIWARPGTVLIVGFVITVMMVFATTRLKLKTQFSDMLPQHIPEVKEFNQIVEDFSSVSTVMVVVESENRDKEEMIKAAEDLVNELDTLYWTEEISKDSTDSINLVRRIDYKVDRDFIAKHGMMMQKTKDLNNFHEMFGSMNLTELLKNVNDNFEKEYVENEENLNSLDGEVQAIQGIDGIFNFLKSMDEYLSKPADVNVDETAERLILGPKYFISSDNTLLMMMIQPTVNSNNWMELMALGEGVMDELYEMEKKYPHLKFGASGIPVLGAQENEAIKKDFSWSSIFAILIIFAVLIGSFRAYKAPVYSIVVLIMSLIWVGGTLALAIEYLNMFSASFAIVLIGLGIDFSIHVVSGYKDAKETGYTGEEALLRLYEKVGNGVVTGAFTTSMVFFGLGLVRFAALTELGFAVGTGILICLTATMIILPAFIAFEEKRNSWLSNYLFKTSDAFSKVFGFIPKILSPLFQFRFLEKIGIWLQNPILALVVIILTGVSIYVCIKDYDKIGFEYDMLKLEPEDLSAIATQNKILDKFELSPDFVMFTVDNLEASREKIKAFKKLGNRKNLIGRVDAVSEFIPEEPTQNTNKNIIKGFKQKVESQKISDEISPDEWETLKNELNRLHQNFVEMGEMSIASKGENNKIIRKTDQITGQRDEDSKILQLKNLLDQNPNLRNSLKEFQKPFFEKLRSLLVHMGDTSSITVASLPHDLRKRYNKEGSDQLLVTIYPKANVWDEKSLRRFDDETSKIEPSITGTPIINLIFIDMVGEKGLQAIIYGFIAILVILLVDFRSLTLTLLALLPLVVGAIWILGGMLMFGMTFNYSNFMALPLILGIGIDDGVHVLHRYKKEGIGNIPQVLRFTGKAILLTSITTGVGFGSMGFASHRGIASMGQVLCIGVASCFISSVFVLPAIVTLKEKLFDHDKKEID